MARKKVVYNFDYDTNMGDIEITDYETLKSEYIIDSISYKVMPKKS